MAVDDAYAFSLNSATLAFTGPLYLVFGTKVTSPNASAAVNFHGPVSTCQKLLVQVLVLSDWAFK